MKRIRKIMTLSAFLFVVLAAAMLNARDTQAEERSSVTFTEKKMISKTSDSMTVQWAVSAVNAEVRSFSVSYRERYSPSEDYIPAVSGLSSGTARYTITGLKPGTLYFVRIGVEYKSKINDQVYSFGDYITDAGTAAAAVTGLKQSTWLYFKHQLVVTWKNQNGADGYEVEARKNNGERHQLQKVAHGYTRTATFTNIKNEMVYTVRVRAYQNVSGKKVYTPWSEPITCFAQAPVKSLKIKKGKLVVKWGKVTGANGYRIFVSTKAKKGYKMVKEVAAGKTSAKIAKFNDKKFKAGKNYFVYVQTLKKIGGKILTSPKLYNWDTKKMQCRQF